MSKRFNRPSESVLPQRIFYWFRYFIPRTGNRIGNFIWFHIRQPLERRRRIDKPYKASLKAARKRKR